MRLHLALTLPLLAAQASALWPFKPKRFTAEALVDAGTLGLKLDGGRVAAIGDADGDQNSDLFVISEDKKKVRLWLWDRDNFRYKPGAELSFKEHVRNIVPMDFDADGRLDLLVMMGALAEGGWWGGGGKPRTDMEVVLGGAEGFGTGETWPVETCTAGQPLIFDAEGSLRPSMLAFLREQYKDPVPRVWFNNGTGFEVTTSGIMTPSENACEFGDLHSSAYVDIDGDCRPDLVLHCKKARPGEMRLQTWLNNGDAGYHIHQEYDLPPGAQALTFADINRDGAIDLVFPTCAKTFPSRGTGSDCAIHIAYNVQAGLCSTEASQFERNGDLKCRGWGDLCRRDKLATFSLRKVDEWHTSFNVADLFPDDTGVELMVAAPGNRNIQIPIRAGDFDVDGFPDLLITVRNGTSHRKVKVLKNVPCGKGVFGCPTKSGRGFVVAGGKGWEALEAITDSTGASWIDLDDDGSLDIMVHRDGKEQITFIQNNFFHDAFFLKAQVLNGACEGTCEPAGGGKKYSALGAGYSGASFKFTVFDTAGRRHAQQVPQLPQTGYQALQSPHTFIGLGRTNNYVENLVVGTTLYEPDDGRTSLEAVIPNSQLIVNPPWPLSGDSLYKLKPPVTKRNKEWRTELFLHPGDWIPWVAAAVLGTVVTLGFVVWRLDEREKKEDERERRRALHAINFQAL
ncbi:hypothetical protein Q8F55_009179 [Vanrija albida]|uniref:T-cell immunomodulatory protein TIP C2 domain-containing protein n=1 Tax=Vanrija albida TaxID=181172 RepID=A0ABR3PT45_9TREE